MADAFTALWTQDTCRALLRAGRAGLRPPVAFSGIHQSLPSWTSVAVGDDVYALRVDRGELSVVCRMRVLDKERGPCCGAAPSAWDDPAHPGHADWSMLGADGCGAGPVHVDATPVRFDAAVPEAVLPALTWRNRRGETRTLKHVVDGRLRRAVSLQGVYRLTPESAEVLAGLVAAPVA